MTFSKPFLFIHSSHFSLRKQISRPTFCLHPAQESSEIQAINIFPLVRKKILSLKACVHTKIEDNTSHLYDIPWYTTRNR